MKNRFSHLNAELKPLVEGETPTAEIPHVNYIEVSPEEYKRMFLPWTPPPLLTIEDVENVQKMDKSDNL